MKSQTLLAPGATALRAITDAEKNMHVREEGGENRGHYVEIYQKFVGIRPGSPWCAAFLAYRVWTAAEQLGTLSKLKTIGFPKSGWTPDYKDWAIDCGLWIPVDSTIRVQRGDLAFFYSRNKGRIYHCGGVSSRLSGRACPGVKTVEANTGADRDFDDDVVNPDGDGVFGKVRNWSEFGSEGGFIRLEF